MGRFCFRALQLQLCLLASLCAKQIGIPNYPNAYNPSVIEDEKGYLLSFRAIQKFPEGDWGRIDASFTGLCRLDPEFNVIPNTTRLLAITSYDERFSLTVEDARLFRHNDKTYLIFNDLPGWTMYLAELTDAPILRARELTYVNRGHMEKNWVPFSIDNNLYLIYWDDPRIILSVDIDTGLCTEISREPQNFSWPYGKVSGGTPALPTPHGFLTFFHSYLNLQPRRVYYVGAYLFSPTYPFSITHTTKIDLPNPSPILFPSGLLIQDSLLHLFYGKEDCEIHVDSMPLPFGDLHVL